MVLTDLMRLVQLLLMYPLPQYLELLIDILLVLNEVLLLRLLRVVGLILLHMEELLQLLLS